MGMLLTTARYFKISFLKGRHPNVLKNFISLLNVWHILIFRMKNNLGTKVQPLR